MNISAYCYLYLLLNNRKPFIFDYRQNSLLFLKKDIVLDKLSDFVFDDYFIRLNNNQYKYSLNNNSITIYIDNQKYTYPIEIKQIESVQEAIVFEDVIKYNNNIMHEDHNSITENLETAFDTKNNTDFNDLDLSNYLNINKYNYVYSIDTDIEYIIQDIQSNIDCDIAYSIDYYSLNPNECGTYYVSIISSINNETLQVEII